MKNFIATRHLSAVCVPVLASILTRCRTSVIRGSLCVTRLEMQSMRFALHKHSSAYWSLILPTRLQQHCLDGPVTSVTGRVGLFAPLGQTATRCVWLIVENIRVSAICFIGTRCALTTEHVSNAMCVTLFSMSSVGRSSCPENLNLLNVSHQIRPRTRFASDPLRFAEAGASALQRDGKPGRSQLGLRPW